MSPTQLKQPAIAHGRPLEPHDLAYQPPALVIQQAIEQLLDGKLISLRDNNTASEHTYGQLWHRAACLLKQLQTQNHKPGQFMILLLDQCPDIVAAFWCCLMGGFVPIPVQFSPGNSQPEQLRLKLNHILETLKPALILTTQPIAAHVAQLLNDHRLKIFTVDSITEGDASDHWHTPQPHDSGALFFSSGTTGTPKLVTFDMQTIARRVATDINPYIKQLVNLSWLPLDHASALFRMATPNAGEKLFLPTELFLQYPTRWLDAIVQYQVTNASMTNFGMALVSQSVKAALASSTWDLSLLNNLGLGAEAIIPQTYREFLHVLSPFGLEPDNVYVGYGLTECGTVVGGNLPFDADAASAGQQFANLGKPCQGFSVRIVDENNQLLSEDDIGQVQVKSPVTTAGYYNNSDATQSLFIDQEWIATGDLGFLHDGELTITGRSKEVIIINAHNYTCQEIEDLLSPIPSLEPAFTIACAVRQSHSTTDQLAIFFSSGAKDKALIQLLGQIRTVLSTQLGVMPDYLVPIDKETVPRTSFGKIKRTQLADQLTNGDFDPQLAELDALTLQDRLNNFATPKTDIEAQLQSVWQQVMVNSSIGIHDNFFELGGNSLLAAQIIALMNQSLQAELPLHCLFEKPTIAELAHYIKTQHSDSLEHHTSLVSLKARGTKPPLYFVNSTGQARAIQPLLDPEQPVYSLNIFCLTPILEHNLADLNLRDIASLFVRDLKAVQPAGPYRLLGYCQDGALTLEVAQLLRQQGDSVNFVGLIDAVLKGQTVTVKSRLNMVKQFGWEYISRKLVDKATAKQEASQEDAFQYIGQPKKDGNITRAQRNQTFYQAYLKAVSAYVPTIYDGRVVLLLSSEWSGKDISRLEAIVEQGLEIISVRGLHNHLFESPFLENLVDNLKPIIEISTHEID